MNGRYHTALCAHLRFVQYCLDFSTCFAGTDETECYVRKDSHTSRESQGISQRLFPVMKSPGISKFCR